MMLRLLVFELACRPSDTAVGRNSSQRSRQATSIDVAWEVMSSSLWSSGSTHPLGISDSLEGEEGDVALDGPGVHETQGFLVAGLAEEAITSPENDREDLQPQLVN